MATGKALGEGAAARRPLGWSRTVSLLNPLRAVWWLFTNVRFALFLLLLLVFISLLGVIIPQVPLNVRGDAVAEQDWLNFQHGRFGFLTNPMDTLGLFDVFHAGWFAVLMGMTVASTGAYIVSRFPGVWQTVTRPRTRVPDRYFEMAPARVQVDSPLDADRLEAALRRGRYRVERFEEPAATYLFADRFQWGQFGTLLTHAAVIVFIFSAVVSRVDGFTSPLFLGEGSTLPVFPVKDANQMQVQLVDARAAFAPDGQPLDYSSALVIYQNGDEVLRCRSTVNSPCSYNGYRFYQAAYFGFGAAVEVRDTTTGNVVYQETLALADKSPSPRVVIKDAQGGVLLDDNLVLTDSLAADGFAYTGTLVTLPGGRVLSIGLQQPMSGGEATLAVFEPSTGNEAVRLSLVPGESGASAGLDVSYVRNETVPGAIVTDFPQPSAGPGQATLLLDNVVYGTDRTSEGTTPQDSATSGPPRLTIIGLKPQAVSLEPGQSVTLGNRQYIFSGQREFAGIQVKRDRSDYLVWIGAALIVLGLMVTFWVPRRRLWARITSTRSYLAGQAPSHAKYPGELRRLAAAAGAGPTGREDE